MKPTEITNEMKQFYVDTYLETYSVSEILRRSGNSVGRDRIVRILKDEGIYEGLNGENYLKKKVENNENIMLERYGVKNAGQLPGNGWESLNSIPYEKIDFLDAEYKKYKKLVEKYTKKNINKIEKPKYCNYTGIRFADDELESVNPNDPRKRSVDHKVPVIICYLNGIDPMVAASADNLVFVLRYVNTIKSNTLHESFLSIAPKIRKVFINEGFESN